MQNGIKTKATILDYVQEKSENGDYTYYMPIIKFNDKHGTSVTQKLESSISPKKGKNELEIFYVQRNNEFEIFINDSLWRTIIPVIIVFLGIVFLSLVILRIIINYP